jgi:hypothetical protein
MIAKQMKRTAGSLRQKAIRLDIPLAIVGRKTLTHASLIAAPIAPKPTRWKSRRQQLALGKLGAVGHPLVSLNAVRASLGASYRLDALAARSKSD